MVGADRAVVEDGRRARRLIEQQRRPLPPAQCDRRAIIQDHLICVERLPWAFLSVENEQGVSRS